MHDALKYKNNPEAHGWTRRFIASEPRLSEAVQLYKESGFEVLLVNLPLKRTGDNCIKDPVEKECRECFNGVEEEYHIIYTRPEN